MARNEEKAQSMMARYWRYIEEQDKGPEKKRPYLADKCNDLREAESWRRDVIRDISRKMSEIQNASLGEHRIRDLNDRINKLMREKFHWERRIRELGGMSYKRRRGPGAEEMTIGGRTGYMYFGAAKDLPGVRELLAKSKAEHTGTLAPKQQRRKLHELVDADYWGFGDDDDGELEWREREHEIRARTAAAARWKAKYGKSLGWYESMGLTQSELETAIPGAFQSNQDHHSDEHKSGEIYSQSHSLQSESSDLFRPETVPDESTVQSALFQRRKQLMLEKYSLSRKTPMKKKNDEDDGDSSADVIMNDASIA